MTNQLRLYNTLTRKKEVFAPLDPARVRMYVCGPTVYDFAHIGNARPVIVFDVLFRLLRHLYGAEHVIYTRNITDVDDKINDRAARDYPDLPLNEAIRKVTEGTNAQFQADVKALGCLEPTHQPRATEHIRGMLEVTQRLLDKGFAYVAEGAEGKEVLFAVTAMPRYGQLSNRKLEEQEAGARVAVEAHKRNPGDFVLWKQSSAGQPGWDASFRASGGTVSIFGRPGWHIECSAMSMATLLEPFGGGLACDDPTKNTFDIHGGGIDLVFPHHENEIAQSCCAFGSEKMAQIWMHNGFLQVEGQKMSKSLGNFVTINELLAMEKFGGRKWPGHVLRFAMLKTHYRQPIDWTFDSLMEAESTIDGWLKLISSIDYPPEDPEPDNEVIEALKDDLNFSLVLMKLHEIAQGARRSQHDGNRLIGTLQFLGFISSVDQLRQSRVEAKRLAADNSEFFRSFVEQMRGEGLSIQEMEKEVRTFSNRLIDHFAGQCEGLPIEEALRVALDELKSLISLRLAARAAKNWAESDRIRDELAAMGIQLKDGKDEAGNPVTTWEVKR